MLPQEDKSTNQQQQQLNGQARRDDVESVEEQRAMEQEMDHSVVAEDPFLWPTLTEDSDAIKDIDSGTFAEHNFNYSVVRNPLLDAYQQKKGQRQRQSKKNQTKSP